VPNLGVVQPMTGKKDMVVAFYIIVDLFDNLFERRAARRLFERRAARRLFERRLRGDYLSGGPRGETENSAI
jgi:hypothetical protein